MENAERYLKYLVEEIHTTVAATVDDDGLPVTAAIDMMDYDADGLYFLTARGKSLYSRLTKRGYIALTAVKGDSTMTSVAISVRGKVREIGYDMIPALFEKNPYMSEIYPTEASMQALTAFHIYDGNGEWFDLSKKPIERAEFSFGSHGNYGSQVVNEGQRSDQYVITDACIGCGTCLAVCPQSCIISGEVPFVIEQAHCLRCGNCMTVCPADAVRR